MMPKYIDVDILKCVVLACDNGRETAFSNDVRTYTVDEILQMINAVKPANVQTVKHGHWIKRAIEEETPRYKSFTPIWACSECGIEYNSPTVCQIIRYCPNCGADMRGGKLNE